VDGCSYHPRASTIEWAREVGHWPDGSTLEANPYGLPAEPPPAAVPQPSPELTPSQTLARQRTPSPQQQAVIDHDKGPALVIASAGSGKTTSIVARITRLIQSGVDPERILGLTFTRDAAREMRKRIGLQLEWARDRITLSTFHSFALELCREHSKLLGRRTGFSVWSDREMRSEMRHILHEAIEADEYQTVEEYPPPPEELLALIGEQKERGEPLDAAFYEKMVELVRNGEATARCCQTYEEQKLAANALDFDDLIWFAVQLLEGYPALHAEVKKRYQYVLVDEYQDTNDLQERLLGLLVVDHQNLMVVGDPDQCLYSWRGSKIAHILGFTDRYKNVKVLPLGCNYRSQSHIVAAASRLVSHNKQRHEQAIWTERPLGVPIDVGRYPNDIDEAAGVALEIQNSIEGGRRPSEHAVLVRLRRQLLPLQAAMSKAGVPYRTAGLSEIRDRPDVRLVLAWWRALCNPFDIAAGTLVLASWPKLGAVTVERWRKIIETSGEPMFQGLGGLHTTPGLALHTKRGMALKALQDTLALHERYVRRGDSLYELATFLWDVTGLDDDIESEQEGSSKDALIARGRVECKEAFLQICDQERVDGSTQKKMQQFLDNLLVSASPDKEMEEMVVLSTIHGSKGLEYEAVWSCGWNDKTLPYRRGDDELEDGSGEMEEERRLAYVTVTRAKDQLAISCVRSKKQQGKEELVGPSPFLDELEASSDETYEQQCQAVYKAVKERMKHGVTWHSFERAMRDRDLASMANVLQHGEDSPAKNVIRPVRRGPGIIIR